MRLNTPKMRGALSFAAVVLTLSTISGCSTAVEEAPPTFSEKLQKDFNIRGDNRSVQRASNDVCEVLTAGGSAADAVAKANESVTIVADPYLSYEYTKAVHAELCSEVTFPLVPEYETPTPESTGDAPEYVD